MRIAFITYEFPPDTGKGGIGTYTAQTAAMLVNAGADVHVFAGSFMHHETSTEQGINIHRVKCSGPTEFANVVLPVFMVQQQMQAFDLIECPEIHGNAREIKKSFPQMPLVVRLHAPNWLVENLKKRYIPFLAKLRFVVGALRRGKIDAGYWSSYDAGNDPDREFTLLAEAVTAPSQVMKDWAVREWKLPGQNIKVIPNPFTPSSALLALPILSKTANSEIVFFGRLNVLKGLVNATHAMKKILKTYSHSTFKVIGDDGPGPKHGTGMRQWMKQELKEVIERVTFIDGVSYEFLPAAIADAGIVLLPSLFESFSYTCAEAMAAGKAVVGSKGTAMADMITDKKSGMLVDANNVSDIYNSLKQLIDDDGMRYRIAMNARERITHLYDGHKLAAIYLDHYKTVAG